MHNIRFIDLKSQYVKMKEEMDQTVIHVMESSAFIQGEEVQKLEKSLANFVGAKHCITCSSGTDGLLLSLMALEIKPGDEVITTPFTFFATAEVICLLGAKPVFVDICPDTYNINASLIEEKITEKTKAIIPVSIYGQCADMDEINQIASKYKLPVIEDAAQSFGAEYRNRKSCNLTTIGVTSFFPSKPLGCYGDGGAVFTNDDKLADKLRMLMNHGQAERYVHRFIGINGRLDAIQAAVLNVKLKYFEEELKLRDSIGKRYTSRLKDRTNEIAVPIIKEDRTCVYAQYSIRVKDRNKLIQKLQQEGIPTAIHYPIPLYRQVALSYLNIDPARFPVTEQVCNEIVSLPMSAYLTESDQDKIIETILK